jgi:hypothetical protein
LSRPERRPAYLTAIGQLVIVTPVFSGGEALYTAALYNGRGEYMGGLGRLVTKAEAVKWRREMFAHHRRLAARHPGWVPARWRRGEGGR